MNCNGTTDRGWNVREFGQHVSVVLFFLLLVAGAVGAELTYVTDRQGERPKPVVAIDNVCAWPNLTVLPDGTIVATIFNRPSHGTTAGDVECWASTDGGRTWHKRGTPAAHENEHSNRMNVAAGLAKNGDLLVIASGWTDPARVADFQGDGGYPSSVQLPDGQVLTAFYGQPYHMGVVVWEPPAR